MRHPLQEDEATFVSQCDSEALLHAIGARVRDPRGGIFGPDSVTWKINRESALFLGAGRAAILQLAHPWVATALEQHSNLLSKPVARFHNTFRVVFTMVFGTLDQALRARAISTCSIPGFAAR
ncbi:MAG: oxygenase MpaB family protein [Terracidiphilus sp.]